MSLSAEALHIPGVSVLQYADAFGCVVNSKTYRAEEQEPHLKSLSTCRAGSRTGELNAPPTQFA